MPNFLVLFFHTFEDNRLFGAATFFFPGSTLIGLIMQEKSAFKFSGKLFFMFIVSFSYLLILFVYRKVSQLLKRRQKNNSSFFEFMLNNATVYNGAFNKKFGILIRQDQMNGLLAKIEGVPNSLAHYFPSFNFPSAYCFNDVLKLLTQKNSLNKTNFQNLRGYQAALHIEDGDFAQKFGNMPQAKLVAFKILQIVLVSQGWVIMHEGILGNSIADFMNFYSLNNIVVIITDKSKCIFFDAIFEYDEFFGFKETDVRMNVKFLTKKYDEAGHERFRMLGQYTVKDLKIKPPKRRKEKIFISDHELRLFEAFQSQDFRVT